MPPLTISLLSKLRQVIELIPDQIDAFGDQSVAQKSKRSAERTVFRELLSKLAGNDKAHQTAFLIDQARKISRSTYVKVALESVTAVPDYAQLDKKNRQT